MKVLLIAKTLKRGGAARGANNLVSALRAAGAEVVTIDATSEARDGTKVIRNLERLLEKGAFGNECHCLRFGPSNVDLHRALADHKPDILQLCDISGNTLKLGDLSHVRCPVVHRLSDFWPYFGPYHYAPATEKKGGRERVAHGLMRRLLLKGHIAPDLIVAPSENTAIALRTSLDLQSRLEVVLNATPQPSVDPTPRAALVDTRIRLGFVAPKLADPRKGFDLLPPHLIQLAQAGWKPSLEVFGAVRPWQEIDIPGVQVNYHGVFVGNQIDEVYAAMDILLCPSRFDNSPNVVCEAMARGVPVVAQIGTGTESYVWSGQTGALIDFSSYSEMSLLTTTLESITANYTAMSRASISIAEKGLSPLVIGRRYISLYEELLAEVPRR